MSLQTVSAAFDFNDFGRKTNLEVTEIQFQNFFKGRISAHDLGWYTQQLNATEFWTLCFRASNQLTLGADLKFFYNNSAWSKARRVLDIGCGTGDLILALSGHFPEKSYVGIDSNTSFIDIARSVQSLQPTISFLNHNILEGGPFQEGEEKFDFIILRRVAQHISDPANLLRQLRKLCTPTTAVVFIEPRDSTKIYHPALPTIQGAYKLLVKRMKNDGNDRQIISWLQANAAKFQFQSQSQQLIFPVSINGTDKEVFFKTYLLSMLAIKRSWSISFDWQNFLYELARWYNAVHSYAQVGCDYLELRPVQVKE